MCVCEYRNVCNYAYAQRYVASRYEADAAGLSKKPVEANEVALLKPNSKGNLQWVLVWNLVYTTHAVRLISVLWQLTAHALPRTCSAI